MIRVQAYSRLHFGFLGLGATCAEDEALPARQFGGAGLMVQAPGVRLTSVPAPDWSATGPLAERALAFARCFAQSAPPEYVRPQHLIIDPCAPEHVGLGTGTQLGLAVAQALAHAWELPVLEAAELARRVGRGRRSALGIHGFAHGGFLVEAGKRTPEAIAPLVARADFPEDWRLVLALPPGKPGLHSREEVQAFQQLPPQASAALRTDTLCRLVLLGMLPALAERDLPAFAGALYEFNRTVGEAFAAVQGGAHGPRSTELVRFLRLQGIDGVAQSSWGPVVCAVVEDDTRALNLAERLRKSFDAILVWCSSACNHGARVRNDR